MAKKNGKNTKKNITRILRRKKGRVFPTFSKYSICGSMAARKGREITNQVQGSSEPCDGIVSPKKKFSGDRREISWHNIALFGFMCSGKTSAGRLLARRLGYSFVDTDAIFEKEYGKISRFVNSKGFPAFRRLEKKILLGLLKKKRTVIACGGGLFPSLAGKKCLTVFLKVPWSVIKKRLLRNRKGRPLLKDFPENTRQMRALYTSRMKKYLRACLVVKLSGEKPVVCARKIYDAGLSY